MIIIDANIFMYAAGAPHPHKEPSVALLRKISGDQLEAAMDAEVLQEILHRYRAIKRWTDGVQVYKLARQVIPQVFAVTGEVMDGALDLLSQHAGLSARDAVHAAVCQAVKADGICSYDRHLDMINDLTRLEPHQLL